VGVRAATARIDVEREVDLHPAHVPMTRSCRSVTTGGTPFGAHNPLPGPGGGGSCSSTGRPLTFTRADRFAHCTFTQGGTNAQPAPVGWSVGVTTAALLTTVGGGPVGTKDTMPPCGHCSTAALETTKPGMILPLFENSQSAVVDVHRRAGQPDGGQTRTAGDL